MASSNSEAIASQQQGHGKAMEARDKITTQKKLRREKVVRNHADRVRALRAAIEQRRETIFESSAARNGFQAKMANLLSLVEQRAAVEAEMRALHAGVRRAHEAALRALRACCARRLAALKERV